MGNLALPLEFIRCDHTDPESIAPAFAGEAEPSSLPVE
jgi:hypothetical protein